MSLLERGGGRLISTAAEEGVSAVEGWMERGEGGEVSHLLMAS